MARLIHFYVPEDSVIAAIAEVAIRHGHLEYSLRMMIRSIRRVSIPEAFKETQWWSASKLRKKILIAARNLFGTGEELAKLEEILSRAACLSEERNRIIHGTYAKEADGEPRFRPDELQWQPLPIATNVSALAASIAALTNELNETRIHGWLKQAIAAAAARMHATS